MSPPSLRRNLAGEVQLFLAYGQITGVHDFRDDIHTVFELERNEIRFSVLDFIERRLLPCGAADIGEGFVVIDSRKQEGFPRELGIEDVVKLELRWIGRPELIGLLGGVRLGSAHLFYGLRASSL